MINDHCLMYKKADGLGFGQMQEFPKTSDQLEFFFFGPLFFTNFCLYFLPLFSFHTKNNKFTYRSHS